MGLYHQFQTAITVTKLIQFIQTYVGEAGTIKQNPCSDEHDEDHFVCKERAFKITCYSPHINYMF